MPTKVTIDLSSLNTIFNSGSTGSGANYRISIDENFVTEDGNNRSPNPSNSNLFSFRDSRLWPGAGNLTSETGIVLNPISTQSAVSSLSSTSEVNILVEGSFISTLDLTSIASDGSINSAAISNNRAILGCSQVDDAGGVASGKAYIFNVTTGSLLHTLNNPNPDGSSAFDYFGYSVAISGNYAIVGAYGEDAGGSGTGKAYIFNVTTGELFKTLNSPSTSISYFGQNVDIDGNYAIVGASQLNTAYIFNVTTGALFKTLNNPNAYGTSAGDFFGTSVAISGNYAFVSALFEDDANGTNSGKAYIFDVTTGSLLHTLNNPNAYGTSTDDEFGRSLAISDTYAIVGTAYEDDAGGTSSGKAYIFDVTTGSLLHTLNNPNAYGTSAYDYFGYRVAISGTYAIVGAYGEDDANGTTLGKAYIFDVTTGSLLWKLDNLDINDLGFGYSVSADENYLIISSNNKAYCYKVNL